MSNKQRDIERLSIQNLINAYCIETSRFKFYNQASKATFVEDVVRGTLPCLCF